MAVVRHWDYLEVRVKKEELGEGVADRLTRIPGIHHILQVEERAFTDLHNIYEQTFEMYAASLENKTFVSAPSAVVSTRSVPLSWSAMSAAA